MVILGRDEEVEYIFPEKCPAAFECEYCGNGFVVDVLNEKVECPGCTHGVPYEQIMLAISPFQFKRLTQGSFEPNANISPGTAAILRPDDIRYGGGIGSVHETVQFSQALQSSRPEPFPRIGTWKGERITDENRDRIHREIIKHYKDHPFDGLHNWRTP